jgi:hypothetical protein
MAKAKAEAVTTGYDFTPDEIPVEVKENPFDAIVKQLADAYTENGSSQAVSFIIRADTKTGTVTGQLDRASKDLPVTIRRKYGEPDDAGNVKATIWATKKRAPKGSLSGGATDAETIPEA